MVPALAVVSFPDPGFCATVLVRIKNLSPFSTVKTE